ncbi:MAG: ATP-binding protein [Erysipelotrichaceae bacterium]|nr:ATP-binding protein [Erysipelotrichaceae bacterium]
MMNYLNTDEYNLLFAETVNDNIYIDKSMLIDKLSSRIGMRSEKYVCITRPRRFGKTYNANMLAAYYTKGYDTKYLFDNLNISKSESYLKHLNSYNVIYIDMSIMGDECSSYKEYISRIKRNIISDLQLQYNIDLPEGLPICDYFKETKDSFIFIIDEWDSIFYEDFMDEFQNKKYLKFLKELFKDKPYVRLAYMTGVLPIAKYSSGSSLNNFTEYNFINDTNFTDFFGFNDDEVRSLCVKYPNITYEELEYWYDGYYGEDNQRLFNPRSVSNAFRNGICRSYWTETGPMSEIADCIKNNVDAVKKDIVNLVSGIPVKIKLEGYSATDTELKSRNNILSAMVIFGFLTYHNGCLYIPNHELMLKYEQVLSQKNMGGVYDVVKRSEQILETTLNQDEEALAKMIEEAHDKEIDLFSYNDENSMACLLTLCYLKARDDYDIKREDKTGKGRCDMIFRPLNDGPAIIIELKVNDTPESAIQQILDKNYIQEVKNCNEILLVGISYNKKDKIHKAKIEKYQ